MFTVDCCRCGKEIEMQGELTWTPEVEAMLEHAIFICNDCDPEPEPQDIGED